jgi:hypothetical protein
MKRISDKRKATAKLGFNSTFGTKTRAPKKLLTIAEMREQGLLQRASKLGDQKGKTSRAKWKAAADKWFSEWIRLRDSDEHGIATCITSGKRAHWRTMDCGHYVSRAKMATRYHEHNCHAQSKRANQFQGGHFVEHGDAIDRKHGEGRAKFLRELGMRECRMTEQDFRFKAESYRAIVMRIKETEPNKYSRA